MRKPLIAGLCWSWLVAGACLAQVGGLTADSARKVFEEAGTLSKSDNGSLWGVPLYGPMLLVDRESRRVVANQGAAALQKSGDVYVGMLPDSLAIANTAMWWGGVHWTMVLWPLPDDPFDRRSLVAHELWHRVEPELGFPAAGAANLHLGSHDGRVWLRLEWKALAAALLASGAERSRHVKDALTFRAKRMQLFPGADEEERVLLMHEGLAQYTGYALSGRSPEGNHARAAREIDDMAGMPTFVRSFAYPTGAAYGLLLDDLAPGWQRELTAADDLAKVAARAVGFAPGQVPTTASDLAERYDGAAVISEEDRRETERVERLEKYRARFVDGPTLELYFVRMSVQFDPGNVDVLDDLGNVYPSLRLTDDWGVLSVDGGALITADWRKVVVPVPEERVGSLHTGDGYKLELADGWTLVTGARVDDRVAWHIPQVTPTEVTLRTRDGVTIYGDLYLEHDASSPLILLFHQEASNARAEYGPIAPRLIDAGFNLLAIDQRRGGRRFGGENRTVDRLGRLGYSYCECYEDLEAALGYARDSLGARQIVAWGSSYSAALVFKLGVNHPRDVSRILAFSPALGDPVEGCTLEPYAAIVRMPALILRPARELQLDYVSQQFEMLKSMKHQTYVAEPAVHGSSMLNSGRVRGDAEPTWQVVLHFLLFDQ